MRTFSAEQIAVIQGNPKNIRNVCIIAHVDHGKTTLADSLIASNGIISPRLAGKLRYMDNTEEEQKRGITMKASAISLLYSKENQNFLINLIDSPGHIDFSSEVSTAVRLCDGAIVLVDVVEGVCPQTHAVLRQAWLENIKPCLVLNKIDRLIVELKLSPLEAYIHLQQILEQVNAITGALFTSEHLEKTAAEVDDENKEATDVDKEQVYDWSSGLDETDDSTLYFSPDQGNVVFASAIDGWAFGINHFAEIFAKKLGVKFEILKKTLWGDFFLNTRTKRIMRGAQQKGKKPLFVQFVLENLWNVYDTVLEQRDKIKIEKIVNSLGLTIAARDARVNEPRVHLNAILRQWLPLSDGILDLVCSVLPSPLDISPDRVEKLMCGGLRKFESLSEETKNLKQYFLACSPLDDKPVIAFVSKMFSVPEQALPKHRKRPLTQEELEKRREIARQRHAQQTGSSNDSIDSSADNGSPHTNDGIAEQKEEDGEYFVAFARVFSGTIRKGQQLYVLGPKYDPSKRIATDKEESRHEDIDYGASNRDSLGSGDHNINEQLEGTHMATVTINDLYLMMSREFEGLEEVPAGNVLGISGLAEYILKSATLSTSLACPPFTPMTFEAHPIVRVAVEPEHPSELASLVKGLKLLNQADHCVQVLIQETGEYVIVAAGEVHLQRCLDDLRQRYAKINVKASSPIVPFRETVVLPPKVDMVNEEITELTTKDHIQRLPTFMLREIHDWGDVIQRTNEKNQDESETDECEAGGNKKTRYLDESKTKSSKLTKDKGIIEAWTANKACCIRVRAVPLPSTVTLLLENNSELIRAVLIISSALTVKERNDRINALTENTRGHIQTFYRDLNKAFEGAGSEWKGSTERIWSFGPRGVGPNILLNRIPGYNRPSVWYGLTSSDENGENKKCSYMSSSFFEHDNSIVSGFQLATLSGPMCEEPMMGVCFVVEEWKKRAESLTSISDSTEHCNSETDESNCNIETVSLCDKDNDQTSVKPPTTSVVHSDEAILPVTPETNEHKTEYPDSNRKNVKQKVDTYGPLSGQLISAMKEGCRRAFMSQPMRLMAAMYSCDIQATADVLGKMYAVLGKREGRILKDDMKEGTDIFDIDCVLPVAESFGFADEIRRKTHGLASPQLTFSHWEILGVDPFWIPTTEEEYLLYGEKADSENQALKYLNGVRRRKGLYVEEKTVQFAEKQRTLKKNK